MTSGQGSFQQRSSFLKRQTWIIFFVVLGFFFQFGGVFVSSNKLLNGLTEIHKFNQLFTLTNQASEGVNSAFQTLGKVAGRTNIDDLSRVFEANFSEVARPLDMAEIMLRTTFASKLEIVNAKAALTRFHEAANAAFGVASKSNARIQEVETQLLLAGQYQLEVNEALRKLQIALRDENSKAFEDTYRVRNFPLIAAILLAVVASVLILAISLYSNRRIRKSVEALLDSTDKVSGGNLKYRAPILEFDEIGKITFAVNGMVDKLEYSQVRTERLQAVTAAFSEALSQESVAGVVMRHGLSTLGADAGSIVLLSEDGSTLSILKSEGYPPEIVKGWETFPMDSKLPLTDAIKEGRAIWLESKSEVARLYPQLKFHERNLARSFAAIPLSAGGRVIGGMVLNFMNERKFSPEDQAFCLSLARQCAQALNRAELYDQAERAVKIRDEFLSIASHELRTPLTPLKLQIQSLTRMVAQQQVVSTQQERLDRMMGTANAQIVRMTRLVDELLDVTRIGAGTLQLEYSTADLSALVRDVIERFGQELSACRSEIRTELESSLVGSFDPFRFEQVLTNLLTNAMRYGPGKPIEVMTRKLPNGFAELVVRDHGIGVAPVDHERIFKRYERAASSNNYGGLGLGLYIARQIVERHGGTIRVESAIGSGSQFIVHIPLQPVNSQPVAREVAERHPPLARSNS